MELFELQHRHKTCLEKDQETFLEVSDGDA
jgi:hypothetical protein